MIQEQGVRCGNWFNHSANWSYRNGIKPKEFKFQWEPRDWYALGESTLFLEDISPIELSPYILSKAGFTKAKNSNEYWSFYVLPNGWYIGLSHHNEPSAGVKEGKCYYSDNYTEVEYLHELQNLVYALCKTELTITL